MTISETITKGEKTTMVYLASQATTIEGLLEMATKVVTWLVTTMGSYLNFVTSNPIILMMAIIMLAGLGVGMLFRIWHSV